MLRTSIPILYSRQETPIVEVVHPLLWSKFGVGGILGPARYPPAISENGSGCSPRLVKS